MVIANMAGGFIMRIFENKKIHILITISLFLIFSLSIAACSSDKSNVIKKTSSKSKSSQFVEATGVVNAKSSESIALDFSARILSVNVKEGQKLKKGDVIYTIDLSNINSQISSAQKQINAEETNLSGLEKQKTELDNLASITLPNTSGTNPDTNLNTNIDTKAYLESQLEAQIAAEKSKIDALQNQLNQLKGQLNKSFLSNGNIICDIDNAVATQIVYNKGDVIAPSQKAISLLDISSIYVTAKVDEQFIKDVKVGSTTNIIPTADSSKKYSGKVTAIASMAQTENGDTFIPVQISVDTNDGFLLPNYNVDINISK